MNFKSIENYLKKNYKFVIIICLFLFLITEQPEKFTPRGGHRVKDQEDFTPTEALDAVKATEKKVNDMASKVGPNNVDFKSGIRLSKNWMNGANGKNSEISNDIGHYKKLMIIGNKSSGTRKVGIWDHLDIHGNQYATGYIKSNSKLCIKGTCFDENDLKKMKSLRHNGGFAIDGEGSTFPLEEGGWYELHGQKKYDAWSNDQWDMIYLYRGWRLELSKDGYGKGGIQKWENKTEDVKKCDSHNDWGSSYRLTWIGY
jgi:hypothetical protein